MLLTAQDMHPYNCTWNKYCIHCTWGVTEWHPDPSKCSACQNVGRIVDEPYAVQVYVRDYSHRMRKIKVRTNSSQATLKLNGVPTLCK